MSGDAPIVVVGTGLAGTRCAATLRRLAPERPVVLVGDEPHAPYERPPLSKELLAGTRPADALGIAGCGFGELRALGIGVRPGTRVATVEPGLVTLDDGSSVTASAIVLATGARPREIPHTAPAGRVHVLRTLDDGLRLRAALTPGTRLCIVGSGFVGAEVASTAAALGVHVELVEAAAVPFERTLGAQVGQWLVDHWRRSGIDPHLGQGVDEIAGRDDGAVVRLAGGMTIEADHALVAIGTVARDEAWHALVGTGGDVGLGIPVDATGRTPVSGIWAAGDVASVSMAGVAAPRRVEHWTDAAASAVRVAHDVAGVAAPAAGSAPYAWSDQFGIRVQVVGHAGQPHAPRLDARGDAALLARYVDASERVHGVVAVGHPAVVARYRRELAA